MRHIFTSILVFMALPATAADYCLAVRPAGRMASAHWGAIASVVERLGLPSRQAGGGTATLSLMLVDGVAQSPALSSASEDERRSRAALMIKSLEGATEYIAARGGFTDFARLFRTRAPDLRASWLTELREIMLDASALDEASAAGLLNTNSQGLSRLISEGTRSGLLLTRALESVKRTMERAARREPVKQLAADAARVLTELVESIARYGIKSPDHLLSEGVLDFDLLTEQTGRLAAVYANAGGEAWDELFRECRGDDMSWTEIVDQNPDCGYILEGLLDSHFTSLALTTTARQLIGSAIPTYATVVRIPESAPAMWPGLAGYGYWGGQNELENVVGLEDQRPLVWLGRKDWRSIVTLAAAEPGLSGARTADGFTTFGAWVDLGAVSLLRAAGCESVVYITRRGGDDLVDQAIAMRVLGIERDPKKLASDPPAIYQRNWIANLIGDPVDFSSPWSRAFNLANPGSAIRRQLAMSDVVLCAAWNNFSWSGWSEDLAHEAYRSPFFVRDRALGAHLSPQISASDTHPDGYPIYAGCF